ncbi:MAG: D-glycero-beta-D-manno-heptose-1,7-bisphosphate 7-phosphatase [Desulfococcus sp. 4484_241]|nr:MAG: D-glycero-beta-D-manno-heptose-1,7-bisphosphate 7-phosphatase [Desulfococcus sp. 4484_241]
MDKPGLANVVFLDRDGVINEDSPEYIKSWAEVRFIPGSLEALRRLTDAGFAIIIVTNQSAIGRKLITLDDFEYISTRMMQEIEKAGGRILDLFFCPHVPDDGCCCRKPKPGMIHKAREKYTIEMASSSMIGDSARDIECAIAAGCPCTVLVETGNGKTAKNELGAKGIVPTYVASDLLDAAMWLIANSEQDPAA